MKNLDHFYSYCMFQIWLSGFLQNFWQYFEPPDFDISLCSLESVLAPVDRVLARIIWSWGAQ